jgi:hypothetical protein
MTEFPGKQFLSGDQFLLKYELLDLQIRPLDRGFIVFHLFEEPPFFDPRCKTFDSIFNQILLAVKNNRLLTGFQCG